MDFDHFYLFWRLIFLKHFWSILKEKIKIQEKAVIGKMNYLHVTVLNPKIAIKPGFHSF